MILGGILRMVFSSILFMFAYLPIVLLVYYFIPAKWRNVWLFFVNFIFYGWGEPVYVILMLFSICLNYFAGYFIEKYRDNRKRARLVLTINTVLNLALLFFFKYFDLILSTLSLIPGVSLSPIGLSLPIGISFYTFQTMSYPIDLYRGDCEVQKNFISFGTFVALFPQLIAGPIVRYKDIASQLGFRANDIDQFASGIQRFIIGLGKKVLIANNIGHLWDSYAALGASELTFVGAWLGAVAFAIQIYFDFSGYSDMAIGLGRMLGFEFLENFNFPYISTSATEFWRRWHMSLGTWFRDYLYIPLGGNRCGKWRQMLNLLIVWAATGIWHGASWTFLIWGLYYGIFIIIEKFTYGKWLEKGWHRIIGHIYCLILVVAAWPIFQLASLELCVPYYKAMFGAGSAGFISSFDIYNIRSYLVIIVIGILASTPIGKKIYDKIPVRARTVVVPVMVLVVLAVSTAYLVDATYNPFLYFRF